MLLSNVCFSSSVENVQVSKTLGSLWQPVTSQDIQLNHSHYSLLEEVIRAGGNP